MRRLLLLLPFGAAGCAIFSGLSTLEVGDAAGGTDASADVAALDASTEQPPPGGDAGPPDVAPPGPFCLGKVPGSYDLCADFDENDVLAAYVQSKFGSWDDSSGVSVLKPDTAASTSAPASVLLGTTGGDASTLAEPWFLRNLLPGSLTTRTVTVDLDVRPTATFPSGDYAFAIASIAANSGTTPYGVSLSFGLGKFLIVEGGNGLPLKYSVVSGALLPGWNHLQLSVSWNLGSALKPLVATVTIGASTTSLDISHPSDTVRPNQPNVRVGLFGFSKPTALSTYIDSVVITSK